MSDIDDDESLSEGAIAALEAELAELEGNNDDDDLDVDTGKDDDDVEELDDDDIDDAELLSEEDKTQDAEDESEDNKIEKKSQQKNSNVLEEQIDAELEDMGDGLSAVQLAVKLKMKLKDELMQAINLETTRTYIEEKLEKLQSSEGEGNAASEVEIELLNEQITELKTSIEKQKQDNIKMFEAIDKFKKAHEKLIWERELADTSLQEIEKRRHTEAKEISSEIKYITEQFVECKKAQNNSIRTLTDSIEKEQKQKDLWILQNEEIQGDINSLESTIQTHLDKQNAISQANENATDDHDLAVEKIQLKITRQQKQYDITKKENDKRRQEIADTEQKFDDMVKEQARLLEHTEELKREARKIERASTNRQRQIKTLEDDKTDARDSLRRAQQRKSRRNY